MAFRSVVGGVPLYRRANTYTRLSTQEQKDITLTNPAISLPAAGSATATLKLLNGVAQGTTAITRLGRKIVMKSLYINGVVYVAPTSTGATPVRVLVVYDKQSNGTAPVATDVVQEDAITSPMNLGNSSRFEVICDHWIPCVGTAGPQAQPFRIYKKLNHKVEFNAGSAGTIADIQTGSVYVLVWTTNAIGTAALLTFNDTRIRFVDN